MAVQKRRKSKATRDHRRSAWMRSTPKPAIGTCPKCQEPRTPHRVCGHCGYYGELKVLDVEEAG